jgi:hypothetical protein
MTRPQIEAAYLPFAEALRAGGFSDPAEGWTAGQVGAHITLNNELLTDLAELVHDGEETSYDNKPVVDDDSLLSYASRLGGLPEIADAVQASAARLAAIYARLTDQERALQIPARMTHAGQVVMDDSMALGDLIIGNGEFHLSGHFEQLKALRRH